LEAYEESAVLHGRWFGGGCVNCHACRNYDPNQLSLHVRGGYGDAALVAQDRHVHSVAGRLGHAAWHPSGQLVVFSRFDIQLFYHTARGQTRDALDSDSMLAYYRLDSRTLQTAPPLADKAQLETQPAWSPDGRYLYFASAPKLWADATTFPAQHYAHVRYDLKRVRYDVATDQWGSVETVLSAERTGKSNVNPRPSPDGRCLLFGMCHYGDFALYQPDSDLYLLNLQSGEYRRLECNSEFAEAWHCWSSNGRWIIFSSKRPTGIFTRLYLCHVDEAGHTSRAFLLPQRDPSYYDDLLSLYSVPEFMTGPVPAAGAALLQAVRDPQRVPVDGLSGATSTRREREPQPLSPQ
jgi:dipeptidyl aminopeptidase/acylaminoacyl peptidase